MRVLKSKSDVLKTARAHRVESRQGGEGGDQVGVLLFQGLHAVA